MTVSVASNPICLITEGTYFKHDNELFYVIDKKGPELKVENCKSLDTTWIHFEYLEKMGIEVVNI